VESFIGKDRGYRALTFLQADGLELAPLPDTLALGDGGVPLGWRKGADELLPVGAVFHRGDTLRAALDAVLTSPVGQGICVDGTGKAIGVIDHESLAGVLHS
jgi:osmoprotectant transport system ATP-binding protein